MGGRRCQGYFFLRGSGTPSEVPMVPFWRCALRWPASAPPPHLRQLLHHWTRPLSTYYVPIHTRRSTDSSPEVPHSTPGAQWARPSASVTQQPELRHPDSPARGSEGSATGQAGPPLTPSVSSAVLWLGLASPQVTLRPLPQPDSVHQAQEALVRAPQALPTLKCAWWQELGAE